MSEGADIAWRVGLYVAAAVAAFIIALYAVGASSKLSRRDVAAAAVAFWALFVADMLPLVAALSGRPVSVSYPFTIAMYVVAFAWAVYAASRGMGRGVVAAAVGVVLTWLFNFLFKIVFAWVHQAALK